MVGGSKNLNPILPQRPVPEFSSLDPLSIRICIVSTPEANLYELNQWASLLSVYQLGLVNGESRQGSEEGRIL